jgi:hypothetical protein
MEDEVQALITRQRATNLSYHKEKSQRVARKAANSELWKYARAHKLRYDTSAAKPLYEKWDELHEQKRQKTATEEAKTAVVQNKKEVKRFTELAPSEAFLLHDWYRQLSLARDIGMTGLDESWATDLDQTLPDGSRRYQPGHELKALSEEPHEAASFGAFWITRICVPLNETEYRYADILTFGCGRGCQAYQIYKKTYTDHSTDPKPKLPSKAKRCRCLIQTDGKGWKWT